MLVPNKGSVMIGCRKPMAATKNVVVIVPFNQDTLGKDEAEQLKSEFKII